MGGRGWRLPVPQKMLQVVWRASLSRSGATMALRKYETRACDRCGREVELMATPEAWTGWWEARLSRLTSGSSETLLPSRADLCPNCAEEMAVWWRAGN